MDTKAIRMLEFIKKYHPLMYHGLLIDRPDIVKEAYHGVQMGSLGDSSIIDSILSYGQKALNLYNQQQAFNAQMKQAQQMPVQQIKTQTVPVQQLSPKFSPETTQRIKSSSMLSTFMPVIAGAGLLMAVLMMRTKRR